MKCSRCFRVDLQRSKTFLFSRKAGVFLHPCPSSTRCPVFDDPSVWTLCERRPRPTARGRAPGPGRCEGASRAAVRPCRAPLPAWPTDVRHVMGTPRRAHKTLGVHRRTAVPPTTGRFRGDTRQSRPDTALRGARSRVPRDGSRAPTAARAAPFSTLSRPGPSLGSGHRCVAAGGWGRDC